MGDHVPVSDAWNVTMQDNNSFYEIFIMYLISFTLADDRVYCNITIIMIYDYPCQVNLYKYMNA